MRKREKFLISSFFLSFGLLGTQYVPLDYRLLASALLFFITYAVSCWALFEDLNGIEWLTIVPFPGLYAVSVSLFYFLLPENLLSKILVLALFGVGMYATYLTSNIYTVAKFRTIQLLRAAHAVGFLMTLFIMFFFANTVFSFHWPFWLTSIAIFLSSFPLAVHSLWSVELLPRLGKDLIYQGLMVSSLLALLSASIAFLPTTIWISSLYIVGSLYTGLGILVTKLNGRLFQNTVWEYMSVWLVITSAFFFMVQWK
jgi:hypothetical protein